MSAAKLYDDYYETGSTARKKAPEKQTVEKVNRNKNKSNIKTANKHAKSKKNSVSLFLFILCGFGMAMIITYRFNLINEKNLEVQKLKSELVTAEATLTGSQIEVEQKTDINKIEAYAKQQLGMQKPDKNQTIYVDTSENIEKVEVENTTTFFGNIVNSIKNFIQNIF